MLELLTALEISLKDKILLDSSFYGHLCIEAAKVLGVMNFELDDKYPEFIDWIDKVGKELNSNYDSDDPWNCSMQKKMEILRNKIEELEHTAINQKEGK